MGCDIHSFAEVRQADGTWQAAGDVFPYDELDATWRKKTHGEHPFDLRNYGLFGFLAGVRNYSGVPAISQPRGVPDDASPRVLALRDDPGGHTPSWLSLRELVDFDYDAPVEDRRYTKQTGPNSFDGGATAAPGAGTMTTWREFLPEVFFRDLEILKTLGPIDDVRVVFNFDN